MTTRRTGALICSLGCISLLFASGVTIAIIPANVPIANKQGNGNLFQLASGSTVNGHCIQYDATGNATDSGFPCGSGSGTPGATYFSSTSQAGPSNSAAETTLIGTVVGSTAIAANTFTDGALLDVSAAGYFTTPALADALTLRYKCGSTVLASSSVTLTSGGGITNGTFRANLTLTGIGSGAAGAFGANGVLEFTDGTVTYLAKVLNTSNVAFDFTTSCAFNLTAQWGAATVSESITGAYVSAYTPGAPVTSVFGQTGGVNIPVTTTDIATPANPGAGTTKWYTKSGTLCALSPGGTETCTGTNAVTSVFGQTGVVNIPITTTDIATPANPLAGTTKAYTKSGKWCSLDPSGNEKCTGAAGAAGALVLVEQHTASGTAELDFTTCITSTYDTYLVEFVSVVPATNLVNVSIQFSTDGGVTYDTGNQYSWASLRNSKGASAIDGSAATGSISFASGGQSNSSTLGGLVGHFTLYSPLNASFHPRLKGEFAINDGSGNPDVDNTVGGSYLSTTAVNAFRAYAGTTTPGASGNLASGTLRCYGVAK